MKNRCWFFYKLSLSNQKLFYILLINRFNPIIIKPKRLNPLIEIIPATQQNSTIKLPGSKYLANRLIPLCALASTPSTLNNIVDNNDIKAAISGLSALGYNMSFENNRMQIDPRPNPANQKVTFNTSHSGTFSRFVTAIAALESVEVKIECSDKMATRPMKELFAALRELGVMIESEANNDRLPAKITGPITKNNCQIDASRSSQFLSALLMVAPLLAHGLTIKLVGEKVSQSYVEMTLYWMREMGVKVEQHADRINIEGQQSYKGIDVTVPGDPVSSSYFMGLAAITQSRIKIQAFDFESLQGESKFYTVLERMGMRFEKSEDSIVAIGTDTLQGINVDMGNMPDVVQTLAVIASFAKGKTHITNIAHLAFKESNRIKDTATELIKAGVKVEFGEDYLLIEGGQPSGTVIETYDDHRMAMSMALLGAKASNIIIKDPQVVNKSFPTYWQLMADCGLASRAVKPA